LATTAEDGGVDLVPITFAPAFGAGMGAVGDVLYSAVDHKPKRTVQLARLANIARRPQVTVLLDHRDDADWSALWWVRARGTATVEAPGTGRELLVARYRQYSERPPEGPVVVITVTEWRGWSGEA